MKKQAFFLLVYAISPMAGFAGATYSVTPLPTVPRNSSNSADTISSNGVGGQVVVGDPSQFNQVALPVLWQGSQIAQLPLPTGYMGGVLSLNNFGVAAGWIRNTNSLNPQPAVWTNGQLQQLSTLGLDAGTAYSINDSGQAVGQAYDEAGQSQAVLWSGGQATALSNFGAAFSINNAGQILVVDATGTAGVLTNGVLMPITSTDGSILAANVMNNAGHVAGEATFSPTAAGGVGFLWADGVERLLPVFSGDISTIVRGINDSDQVVGSGFGTVGGIHALLWQDGQVFDLNDLLPADSGWTLQEAMGIADDGTIVGYGTFDGQFLAYELTPSAGSSVGVVPEPASGLLLLASIPLMLRRRRVNR